eukprot:XP_001695498.1 serine/threonine protein kinase 23 [Chlamydomonas reinhardtii]
MCARVGATTRDLGQSQSVSSKGLSEPEANRYEFVQELDEGSYGCVFACVQRPSGRLVAVKVCKHTEDPVVRRLLLREVGVLRSLPRHPCVVELLDAFRSRSSGRPHLVFECMERSAQQELEALDETRMCPVQLKLVAWQVVMGLAHCHRNNVIHRDLKPGNILLAGRGAACNAKLCDFGFARNMLSGRPDMQERLSSYVVTRWYRAPEILVGDKYGMASDVWALGCTLAELANGGLPLLPGTSSLDQLARIMRCCGPLPPCQALCLHANRRLAPLRKPPPRSRTVAERLPGVDPALVALMAPSLAVVTNPAEAGAAERVVPAAAQAAARIDVAATNPYGRVSGEPAWAVPSRSEGIMRLQPQTSTSVNAESVAVNALSAPLACHGGGSSSADEAADAGPPHVNKAKAGLEGAFAAPPAAAAEAEADAGVETTAASGEAAVVHTGASAAAGPLCAATATAAGSHAGAAASAAATAMPQSAITSSRVGPAATSPPEAAGAEDAAAAAALATGATITATQESPVATLRTQSKLQPPPLYLRSCPAPVAALSAVAGHTAAVAASSSAAAKAAAADAAVTRLPHERAPTPVWLDGGSISTTGGRSSCGITNTGALGTENGGGRAVFSGDAASGHEWAAVGTFADGLATQAAKLEDSEGAEQYSGSGRLATDPEATRDARDIHAASSMAYQDSAVTMGATSRGQTQGAARRASIGRRRFGNLVAAVDMMNVTR